MYSKDELLSKDVTELAKIASELGVTFNQKDSQEDIIYAILDKQAIEEGNRNPLSAKRKRTRIVKKDTDRVYTVKGKEGENLDTKKSKSATAEQKSLFKDEEPTSEEVSNPEELLAAMPKHRGRKSKKELELIAAAEAARAKEAATESTEATAETPKQPTEEAETTNQQEEIVPEAAFSVNSPAVEDTEKNNLLEQLQAKMNDHNKDTEEAKVPVNGVWEGDPADGTDFITVVDLPIEDQGIVPNFDMFDNPTTGVMPQQGGYQHSVPAQQNVERFDFSDLITANGVLEAMPDGYGFLRSSDYNYLSSPDDIYVATNIIKKYGLKTGDVIQCHVRPPHDGEKYFPLTTIDKINGRQPTEVRDRIPFEHLTPLFPEEKFTLCGDHATTNLSTRIVDLFSPIGKGQRALIVAQPKTGKTILMKDIANAIAANHPEA